MHNRFKIRKPRILIGGIIPGAGNIGDDGITEGVLHILDRSLPDAEITIGTYRGQKLDHLPDGLTYTHSLNSRVFSQALRRCDLFVCGGATLIGDELGLGYPLLYTARLISLAKLYGKPVYMLGIGANRLRRKEAITIAKTILSLSDFVTLRDEESRNVCLGLGANPNRVVTTSDPAFLLEPRGSTRTKELKERLRARGKVFGVNVVNEAWENHRDYKAGIARACEYLHEKHGFVPAFFCNEVRSGNYFDFEANRQTAAFLTCEHELLEPIYYSPGEMLDIISSFEFIISMRMHSLIFAAVASVPFAAVSRTDKVDNLMRLFGLAPSGSVDRCDAGEVVRDVENLLERRDSFLTLVSDQVGRSRRTCLQNSELMRNLLNERRLWRHKATVSSIRLLLAESRLHALFGHAMRRCMSGTRSLRNFIKPKAR